MKYILSLDQSTTHARALVMDNLGRPVSVAEKEITQIYPRPGWVEHDPNEIWSAQIRVAAEAMERAHVALENIAAVGITNQRETTVIWDRKTSEPIANAIVWQDRRTSPMCETLKADGLEPFIQQKTGLMIDAYFSATKVRWLLDHIPGARARAELGELAFGTIDSWLIWKLTEGQCHCTDETNASRTMLYNIRTRCWDDHLLNALGIPRLLLPQIRSSSEVYCEATTALCGVPIAGNAGDQQAALFGHMCNQPGMVKNTYGTGCFMLMNIGSQPIVSKNKLVTTVSWRINQKTEYSLEGSVFSAGAVVEWLRDGLGIIRSSDEVERLAATVEDNAGVYFVPAFAGLGAPYWDPYAQGRIVGLTRATKAGHIARAALESIAYQITDILTAMESDSGARISELRVDGGACRNRLLMQFQADILGVPVVSPKNSETTAMGAAYLAGLGVGYFKSTGEIAAQRIVGEVFTPKMSQDRRESLRNGWRKVLSGAKSDVHASLP